MCDKDEKCNLDNLNEYDIKINKLKVTDMYNGTYLVCIVYGIFSVAILLGSYFNDSVRDIFFNQFIIFTVIFIIGSIVIISVLIYYLNNYVPKKTKHVNLYDTYSCPDYWNMVMLDDNNVYKNFDSNISPNYFKYKCVINPNIFDRYDNYDNPSVNNKQVNYNLTNNLLNTTNLDENIKGDYYNDTHKDKIKNNMEINKMGHLYKNITNTSIFPLSNTENYFVYNRPGVKITEKDFINVKDAIINTSLTMNNYAYNSLSNTYSNINNNSFNENNDPYITWNYNNALPADITTNYGLSTNYKIDPNNFYENFYVYKWTYDNIKFNNYNNLFITSDEKVTISSLSVFAGYDGTRITDTNAKFIKIGDLIKDNDKIYFKSIPNINTNKANMLFDKITPDSNNNKIINSYIDTGNRYSTINLPKTNTELIALDKGPLMIVDNGYGRPPVITADQIKSNTLNIPVVCDTIYPAYLASVEDINAYGADNAIRCSYAKLCGYSWSDMGCN